MIKLGDIYCSSLIGNFYELNGQDFEFKQKLLPMSLKLLNYLHKNLRRVVSVENILEDVWEDKNTYTRFNVIVQLNLIRDKIDKNKEFIKNLNS